MTAATFQELFHSSAALSWVLSWAFLGLGCRVFIVDNVNARMMHSKFCFRIDTGSSRLHFTHAFAFQDLKDHLDYNFAAVK